MWSISTLPANNFVTHHFKWWPWPGRAQITTDFCGRGALGTAFSYLSSGPSVSLDASSWSGSGYTSSFFASNGKNISHSHRKIGDSNQVSSGHSSCHYPETSLRSSVSPNTNAKHACRHLWNLHAPEAPRELYLSTRVSRCAFFISVHSRSIRCVFSCGIQMSGFPLASFNSDHRLIVHGFAIWIIRCAASCWAYSFLVRTACIKLFTAEYNASAPCVSITVLSSGSSGAPENSHIIWKHQS